MYYFITASKDASIFLQQPKQNTGLDEVLEVSKTYYGSLKDTARSLIKFETSDFSESIARHQSTLTDNLTTSQSVQTSLSESWDSTEASASTFSASYDYSSSLYTTYSASLAISSSNFTSDSSSLVTLVSESNTNTVNAFVEASGSIVLLASQSLATSASWASQSLYEANLSSSYLLISASYNTIISSSITSSLADSSISTSFLSVSSSYVEAISQSSYLSSSYNSQSSSVYNQQTDLGVLELHIVSSSESSSLVSHKLISSASLAFTASNDLFITASGSTLEVSQSALIVSESWSSFTSQSLYNSASYNTYSESLASRVSDGDFVFSYKSDLILRETEPNEIPLDYTIYAYAVSQSWEMGNGTRFDEISSDGVTWNYRASGSNWLPTNVPNSGSATGSYNGRGGMWYTSSFGTQSFSYESTDLQMNVKPTIEAWVSGTFENEGFIIKHESQKEDNNVDYGELKFFSKETHTIYQPKLRLAWDDSRYETGSLLPLADEYKVALKRLKKSYKVGGTYDIEVFARELYPQKTFQNKFGYTSGSLLPSSSFYQIRDFESDDIIIPFSDYSKIRTFDNKSRITVDLTNFEINRSYKIELKIEQSGSSQYFDDDYIFEVIE